MGRRRQSSWESDAGYFLVGFWGLGFTLRGSWLVISGVIGRVTVIITPIRGIIALLVTTHEPPSRV